MSDPQTGAGERQAGDGERQLPEFLLGMAGVEEGRSRFVAGPALWVDGTEILHVDSSGCVDLRLTRRVIKELRGRLAATERVRFRRSSGADWIEVLWESPSDEALLVELLERAADAHREAPRAVPSRTGA